MAQQKNINRGFNTKRVPQLHYLAVRTVYLIVDVVLLLPIVLLSILSRLSSRPVDVGLGPLPTINSRYHKKCLQQFGYSCETFVYYTWYFTEDFDVNIGRYCPRALGPYVAYVFCVFRYRCLYTYFTGGPLGFTTLLARCEPYLFQIAGIRTVIMPFGADVNVLTRTPNKFLTHAISKDYPGLRLQRLRTAAMVDLWTRGADHIIAGCDWVDFLYFWDTLMLSHFAIDTELLQPIEPLHRPNDFAAPLRLIHAPNHRNLKGTDHVLQAVEELRAEGVAIELVLVEGVPNEEILCLIRAADVVVDQLVLGWYAMFALEGMALAKAVVCYLRPDFLQLYQAAGLLRPEEMPLVNANLLTIKEVLRGLAQLPREELREIGQRSRQFVEKHHSIAAIGAVFDKINRTIGIHPTKAVN